MRASDIREFKFLLALTFRLLPTRALTRKAARKISVISYSAYYEDESESNSASSLTSESSASSNPNWGGSSIPPASIIWAIEQQSPAYLGVGRQPTFLRRNLRMGMLSYCEKAGIPVHSVQDINTSMVHLVFRCTRETLGHEDRAENGRTSGDWYEHEVAMDVRVGWPCPICNCLGSMPTMEVMILHFRWAHDQVGIDWDPVSELYSHAFRTC